MLPVFRFPLSRSNFPHFGLTTHWFGLLKLRHNSTITSQPTKFAYFVSSLQLEVVQEIRDILLHPPVDRPYDTLKS